MKFICEKALLVSGVTVASRTVSAKNGLAVLEGIYVRAGEILEMTGYNLETGITVVIPANIRESGSCVLPSKLFNDIIRKLPDEMVSVEVDDSFKVTITCGVSHFVISAMSAEDYPELPDVDSERSLSMPQRILREMISGTIFSVSDKKERPIHTGILFEIEDTSMNLVAVDGFRFAKRTWHPEEPFGRTLKFVAPGAAMREMEKILTDTDDPVFFTKGTKHLLFKVGDCTLICRLLEGEFLDWRRVMPNSFAIKLCCNVNQLASSIDRASLIISEKLNSPLRCSFTENLAEFRCTSEIGTAKDSCPVAGDGKDLEIGFNSRYLMDALRACPDQETMLNLNNHLAPMVIMPADGKDTYSYMLMPVRLKAGD